MTILRLRNGTTICEIEPAIGGAIRSLSVSGISVLRQTRDGSTNVLDTACFPLVPFANRIDEGRFVFRGHEIILPEDPAAPPHAHHGQGWRRAWTVDRLGNDYAELSLLHDRDDWPWRYRATQNLRTTANGLTIVLSLQNVDDTPMPAGLGMHPFFPRGPDSHIISDASELLLNDERGIPITKVAFPPGLYAVASLDNTDNLLLGGGNKVEIAGAAGITRIDAIGATGFHLYVPPGQTFFCVEPVTHFPNSFHVERSDEVLDPGAVATLQVTITHAPRGPHFEAC